MRIVFIANHSSIHTRRWVEHFVKRGHHVDVITCGDDSSAPGSDLYGIHDLGKPRFGRAGYLLKLPRARALVKKIAPDVVYGHFLTSYGVIANFASNSGKLAPLVVTAHGDDLLLNPWKSRLLKSLVTRVLKNSRLLTVPSEQMREAAQKLLAAQKLPMPQTAVFQYGVEVERLSDLRTAKRTRADQINPDESGRPLQIACARAMIPDSRNELLIDALDLLSRDGFPFKCTMIGGGPLLEHLKRKVVDAEIGNLVDFKGQCSADDTLGILAEADIAVSLAFSDGAAISTLEAMALGAIPVLSNIPANSAWVTDGKNGTLAEPDARSIADAIRRAANLNTNHVIDFNHKMLLEKADRDTNLDMCISLIEEAIKATQP